LLILQLTTLIYIFRCGARFAKIEEIEQHATALHKLEDAAYMQSINKSSRTFSCDVCQKTVSSEKNLKRHIKKIHGQVSNV